MNEIDAKAENLSSLLKAKFKIDFYQREYRWEEEQVKGLITDLTRKFDECYKQGGGHSAVKGSDHYFLGPIIISGEEEPYSIIDGQQRLTTLTLLLIHIYRLLGNDEEQLTQLIFTKQGGERLFHIAIQEREKCMEKLLDNNNFDETGRFNSVKDVKDSLKGETNKNIIDGFENVTKLFPYERTDDNKLPDFVDWLKNKVYLVVITPPSAADAYIIFETMNDRGLSLTPTEMLKAYILANIEDSRRDNAHKIWRERVTLLRQSIGKTEDAGAISTWLSSKYGETQSDYNLINPKFHRWVRNHKKDIGLLKENGYEHFIEKDFEFYSCWYYNLRVAAIAKEGMETGLEAVHYWEQNSLQYLVLLAPLRREDSKQDIMRKLRIVSAYLDILIARRIWNRDLITRDAMLDTMLKTMLLIRDKDPKTLVELLTKRLLEENKTFDTKDQLVLYRNGPAIHKFLARLTDYIETSSGKHSMYLEYTRGKGHYQIEHILPKISGKEDPPKGFKDQDEYVNNRNRIGGLLLLPRSFNASFGKRPYEEKREYYHTQNLLAKSLYEKTYTEPDPGFKRFIDSSKLPFEPHPQFGMNELNARQELYRGLAKIIWNPERLRLAYEAKA